MDGVAVITGAGGVLGSAIARGLAQDGWSIALHGLPGEPLDELAEELSAMAPSAAFAPFPFDLLKEGAAEHLLHRAGEWGGRIDGLVNNAALPSRMLLSSLSPSKWERVMHLNDWYPPS